MPAPPAMMSVVLLHWTPLPTVPARRLDLAHRQASAPRRAFLVVGRAPRFAEREADAGDARIESRRRLRPDLRHQIIRAVPRIVEIRGIAGRAIELEHEEHDATAIRCRARC